jgi:hypothetical protein
MGGWEGADCSLSVRGSVFSSCQCLDQKMSNDTIIYDERERIWKGALVV